MGADLAPGDSEPGVWDARGLAVYNGQLYGSDSTLDYGFGGECRY